MGIFSSYFSTSNQQQFSSGIFCIFNEGKNIAELGSNKAHSMALHLESTTWPCHKGNHACTQELPSHSNDSRLQMGLFEVQTMNFLKFHAWKQFIVWFVRRAFVVERIWKIEIFWYLCKLKKYLRTRFAFELINKRDAMLLKTICKNLNIKAFENGRLVASPTSNRS